MPLRSLLLLLAAWPLIAAPRRLVEFSAEGSGGLIEQGIPVAPLTAADAERLVVLDASGRPARAAVEVEGIDPLKRVRWVRVSIVPERVGSVYTLAVADSPPQRPSLVTERRDEAIVIRSGLLEARFLRRDRVQLSISGKLVLDGPITFQLYPDARSIINAGGKTTVLAAFEPAGFELQQSGPQSATVILRGRNPKQKPYNFKPGNNEPKLGFDVEARFSFSALAPAVRMEWRLTNRAGYKSWLERFAMVLPVASATIKDNAAKAGGLIGNWADLDVNGQSLGITAAFADDYGPGFGMRLVPGGLLYGGVEVPPDGGVGGRIPEIHRQFHHGMSRTFRGWLVHGDARAYATRTHLKVPPQYYSDLGILPERNPVNAGEFKDIVDRSARWLHDAQWRGTLWAGEWWREWDVGRRQGTEEASNGNSLLAPLYHYFRTGDERFLASAALSAEYVWDVQHDRKQTGFGPMLHTRRHLLDELDWIHPRYQRAMGPILASHVFLTGRERREMIETVRHFSMQIQSEDGTPWNWDERAMKRGPGETGVDTANFIEALVAAWENTGDPFFLNRARGYARWTLKKWRTRTDDAFWNWNLTRYVLTGMLAICRSGKEYPGQVPELEDFLAGTLEIGRHTVLHPELTSVPGTIGGGDLHYVFYHAFLGVELARLTGDRSLLPQLASIVRREAAKGQPDGTFPMELGVLWSQYPTRVVSYYDAKSVVAYLPVLGAYLAAHPGLPSAEPVRSSR